MVILRRIFEKRSHGDNLLPCYFLNAYAVSVTGGSEPGMGFSWFRHLLQHYNVKLFTEAEFSSELINWLNMQQDISCTVYFFDVGARARKFCWNQGDWRFYLAYWMYQCAVMRVAYSLLKSDKPIFIHQLNMIGFREPGYLWCLALFANIPFIWGPVGGYNFPSMSFYKSYGVLAQTKQLVKNILNWASMFLPSVIGAYLTASTILFATPTCQPLWKVLLRRGHIFPETFLRDDASFLARDSNQACFRNSISFAAEGGILRIVMLGKLVPRKLVDIAIDALCALRYREHIRVHLSIIGDGPVRNELESMVANKNLVEQVHFYGALPHQEALKIVKSSDLLLHCSIDEGTSHAIVEAMSLEIPILAFDCGGHSVIAKSVGLRMMPVPKNRVEAVLIVACAIRNVLLDPDRYLLRPRLNDLRLWEGGRRIEYFNTLLELFKK